MPPLPRGTCQVCGREVALRVNGTAREHEKNLLSGVVRVRSRDPEAPQAPPHEIEMGVHERSKALFLRLFSARAIHGRHYPESIPRRLRAKSEVALGHAT